MWFFKKRKKLKEEYIDPELDIEEEFRKRREHEKDKTFDEIESLQFIHTQCQVMKESSQYINELRKEHSDVREHLNDIRTIESQNDIVLGRVRTTVKEIQNLKERTEQLRRQPSKLSRKQSAMLGRYAEELPEALANLQNDEKYASAVKHDMKLLEAEKISIKEDIEKYQDRRVNIRNVALISLVAIIIMIIVFVSTGLLNNESGMIWVTAIIALLTLLVFLVYMLQRTSVYKLRLSEKKLARTITLLNKTKIKYVNIVNSVDYQYEKYDVKNGYELSKIYETYLEEQRREKRVQSSSIELEDAITRLAELMSKMNLYDAAIWSKQLEALTEPKVMKELKRSLQTRAQKLMDSIEYNNTRIDEAKKLIMDFVKNNPKLSTKVMEIVDSYDN